MMKSLEMSDLGYSVFRAAHNYGSGGMKFRQCGGAVTFDKNPVTDFRFLQGARKWTS